MGLGGSIAARSSWENRLPDRLTINPSGKTLTIVDRFFVAKLDQSLFLKVERSCATFEKDERSLPLDELRLVRVEP